VGGGSNQEYGRFKKEIEDSQVFDRMKNELGFKEFKKVVRNKIRPIAFDLVFPFSPDNPPFLRLKTTWV